jgi:hypothetical protein
MCILLSFEAFKKASPKEAFLKEALPKEALKSFTKRITINY